MQIPDPDISCLDNLYSAVVCDVLDTLGYRSQALPPGIRPLTSSQKIAGRIFTARACVVDSEPAEPYKLEIEAIERMQCGDVFVVDTGNDRTCGFWGELLTTACLYKGVRGAIMNGCSRDLWKIKDLDFPVFGIGCHPADSKGRLDISALQTEIRLGDTVVHPGDLLIGDEDGCVVIPQRVTQEALRMARKKVSGENVARADLAAGVPMGEVFARHGIL